MLSSLCRIRRIGSAAAALTLVTMIVPAAAAAQIAPASIDSAVRRDPCAPRRMTPHAHYIFAPYGWMLGISGETGVRDLSADVHIKFSELLDHLRFGAMGTFEFGYGRWLGIADGLYASVQDDQTRSIGAASPDLVFDAKLTIVQGFGGYSFAVRPNLAIDLLGGTRIWNADLSLRHIGENVTRERARNRTWADALGGVRVRWEPALRWHVSAEGDGGGGGSKGAGEGIGTIGYDVARHWNVFGGYRYLYENYRHNDVFFKGHLGGPVIGGAYRW